MTALAHMLLAGSALAADDIIQNTKDNLNTYYDTASKYFGDGEVQINTRKEGSDGTSFTIYHFDCTNNNYDVLSTGDTAEMEFPMEIQGAASTPFDRNADVAPMAQHACTKHGRPLLEW